MIRPVTAADADAYIRLRREMISGAPFSFGSSPDQDRASSTEFVHAAVGDSTAAIFGALLLIPTMLGAIVINLFVVPASPVMPLLLLLGAAAVAWARRDQLRIS